MLHSFDDLTHVLLLWGSLGIPWAEAWSVDAQRAAEGDSQVRARSESQASRRRRTSPAAPQCTSACRRQTCVGLWVSTSTVYALSGWHKSHQVREARPPLSNPVTARPHPDTFSIHHAHAYNPNPNLTQAWKDGTAVLIAIDTVHLRRPLGHALCKHPLASLAFELIGRTVRPPRPVLATPRPGHTPSWPRPVLATPRPGHAPRPAMPLRLSRPPTL